jgi:catechol 2,3-dioxygenase-like lactoylglutathione lyase family enzyme
MQLNTARVFVKDLSSAKAFYEAKLGLMLKVDGERSGMASLLPARQPAGR